ncbi:MAG TPA: phenylalanine--tRNA ligase subunit beta [Actinomycetota bacterium]|nr:phenylalanine--tRNA ligase subunit beta [Actinomycetota bacterium]
MGWLREFVDIDVPVETLAERLETTGTKVEAVHRPSGAVEGVVVAEVLAVRDHPGADTLALVDVSSGGDSRTVVCGVRNFSVGDRVPLAAVGARLPGTTVGARRIRGHTSEGMLCSPAELGVSKDHSGILVLPSDAPLGADVGRVLGLDETVIEFEITSNRPDCLSVVGIAREVAALLGTDLRSPDVSAPAAGGPANPVTVRIEDDEGCPRYLASYIAGVRVSPSPSWMTSRLLQSGVRPVSNVVDATNYVMLETGQPLHAFDADRVPDAAIVVRRAHTGEALTTLDGLARELHPDDLLIASPERALALAGVMGGADSEVSESTGAVILESAYFAPASVSFTARRHLLRTEASARFERGTDPNGVAAAARRAAALIADTSGGAVAAEEVDEYRRRIAPLRIRLRPERSNALLGFEVDAQEQARHLRSIGLRVESNGALEVEVPTFRPDLVREVDLVEEVARLAGYDRIPSTLPSGRAGGLDPVQLADRRLRRTLAGFGLQEAWTASFGSPVDLDLLGLPPDAPARTMVNLANPTSDEEPAMRTTLLPQLLRAVARNRARGADGIALFEVARVYRPAPGRLADEPLFLGVVAAGRRTPTTWRRPAGPWDFFTLKGLLEATLESMRLPAAAFEPLEAMPWHPTRAARASLGGEDLGAIGEVHPDVCARCAVPEGTVALELPLQPLFEALPERTRAEDVSRFPAVLMDIALIVAEEVPAGAIEAVVRREGAPEAVSVRLFDVYRGEQVGPGRKSLAYALELRSPERTLTDEHAAEVRARIVSAASAELGAELRT